MLVIAAFVACHVGAIYLIDWSQTPLILAVPIIAVQTWLFVGLFIIAHDCMHGSLAPGRPFVNRAFGRLALLLYVAFSYDRLLPEHHKHHRRPGTEADPDFNPGDPNAFWPWFARFMGHYFGWREFFVTGSVVILYVLVAGPPIGLFVLFYGLPAALSALQLFYFGTYRPHRHEGGAFEDDHNSRTDDFSPIVSLFTCFHFGYHHEHHLSPTTPWWALPGLRSRRRASALVSAS